MAAWRNLTHVALRDAAWLTAERGRAWVSVMAVAMAGLGAVAVIGQVAHAGWGGLGRDFTCFWAAGRMAALGHGALVFSRDALWLAERAGPAGADQPYQPFLYPPPFLLFCRVLAVLPYWPAFAAFMAAGLVPLMLCLRAILPGAGLVALLAFPGIVYVVMCGQNGMLSAACFAGFALWADRRPWLAGACLGLLAYKPQLAAVAPLVLLAAWRWRCLGGAALAYSMLCLASLVVLGPAVWVAFLHFAQGGGTTFDLLAVSPVQQARIVSAFDAAILLGAPSKLAWALHACVAGAALAALLWFAAKRPSGLALGAALPAAVLLITPYVLDYDLVCLAPALAGVTALSIRQGWPGYGRLAVLLGYGLPLVATMLALSLRFQIAPLVIAMVLATAIRAGLPASPLPA